MPKRSEIFQSVVRDVEHLLAEQGIVVTESELFVDPVLGMKRESDVILRGTLAGRSITIALECRDQAKRGDVVWVEAMPEKYRHLGVQKIVLVSRSGFTPKARVKAAQLGIDAIDFEDLGDSAPPPYVVQGMIPQYRVVGLDLELSPKVPGVEDGSSLGDLMMYSPEGEELGRISGSVNQAYAQSIRERVGEALKRDGIQDKVLETKGDVHFEYTEELFPPEGTYVVVGGVRHLLVRLVPLVKGVAAFLDPDTQHFKYRNSQVVVADFDVPMANVLSLRIVTDSVGGSTKAIARVTGKKLRRRPKK